MRYSRFASEKLRLCYLNVLQGTMERPELVESPRKRQKIDSTPATDSAADVSSAIGATGQDAQSTKEQEVGITELVTADAEGFSGLLKKR